MQKLFKGMEDFGGVIFEDEVKMEEEKKRQEALKEFLKELKETDPRLFAKYQELSRETIDENKIDGMKEAA